MKPRVKDTQGNLTTYGIYLDSRYYMSKKLKELPKGVTNRKDISWRDFSKVIRLYWQYTFEEVIEGKFTKLRQGIGALRVVKLLCLNYTPKKIYFDGENTEYRNIGIEQNGGYWYYVQYVSKMYRHYRIFPVYKIRKAYMDRVESGEDYIDITS